MKIRLLVLALAAFFQNAAQQQSGLSLQGSVVALGSNEMISGAALELRDADAAGGVPHVATSDRDGKFVLHNVPPGRYRLTAKHSRYVPAAYGERRSGSPGEVLTLSAGQAVPTIRFVLTPTGVISGRVYDRSGAVANAGVAAWRLTFQQGTKGRLQVQSTLTDDLGEYRLFALPPGSYFVTATASTGAPGGFVYGPDRITDIYARMRIENEPPLPNAPIPISVTFPGKSDPFEGSPIDVRPGVEVRNVNLTVGDTLHTTRLRGTAIDGRTRQPAAGTQMNLVSLNGNANRVAPGSPTTTTLDFGFLPPGAYLLAATNGALSGRRFFEIKNEDSLDVSVELQTGFNVPGKIIVEGMNAANASLTSLLVDLRLDVTIGVPGGRFTASPSADGSFVLSKILPGTYTVGILPIQYQQNATLKIPPVLQNAYIKSIRLGSDDGVNGKLHLDNPPQDPIEVVIGMNAASLEGVVMASVPWQPLDGVTVVLAPETDLRIRAEFFKSTATDQAGRFRFERVPPGRYKVFAWEFVENGAWRVPEFLRTDEDRGVPIQLPEGGTSMVDVPIIPAR
jgi:Carboxypeptidase regulatory-like domain